MITLQEKKENETVDDLLRHPIKFALVLWIEILWSSKWVLPDSSRCRIPAGATPPAIPELLHLLILAFLFNIL